MTGDDTVGAWLRALEQRHLQDLTTREIGRALRSLSSCYVERRSRLAEGAALDGAGKRAAFALFYAPLHFLVTREIVRAIPGGLGPFSTIVDIGCGTGAAGAAWALAVEAHETAVDDDRRPRVRVTGVDLHPWAVAEANWTYAQLGITGRATRGDAGRLSIDAGRRTAVLAAYTVNELRDDARRALLERLLGARASGARVLVIEPIARRGRGWWHEWARACGQAGGQAADWRFDTPLPPRQRDLARAAGLAPRELTARTLWL
jgi:SAM-dependent methyltransferase